MPGASPKSGPAQPCSPRRACATALRCCAHCRVCTTIAKPGCKASTAGRRTGARSRPAAALRRAAPRPTPAAPPNRRRCPAICKTRTASPAGAPRQRGRRCRRLRDEGRRIAASQGRAGRLHRARAAPAGRRRRHAVPGPCRSTGPGRRVRLRQIHLWPRAGAPGAAHGRHRLLRRHRCHAAGHGAPAHIAAPYADRVPGPDLFAQPAAQHRPDHRRADALRRPARPRCAGAPNAGVARARRARSRVGGAPATPTVRRPVPAGVDRAGAGRRAAIADLRRSRVGARCLGAGTDRQPAARPAARPRSGAAVHLARPGRRAPHRRPGGGDVPGPAVRGGRCGALFRRTRPPLQPGAAVCGARHGRQAPPCAHHAARRPAVAAGAPERLPFSYPLPACASTLRGRGAAAARDRARQQRCVPLSGRACTMNQNPAASLTRPRNAVVILLDSLNRHLLGAYGATEFETPQIDRFCASALPCMPARHDILCGALDFLWRPWGSIEVWEDAITYWLRNAGVVTQLISDHPHLFESGGENSHADFRGWAYLRGHESDPWKTAQSECAIGAPLHQVLPGPFPHEYDTNRTWFKREEDFPGPQTMARAARWIDENAGRHQRFFLMIDEFDPHEPFDTPQPWACRYRQAQGADEDQPLLVWPPHAGGGIQRGVLTAAPAHGTRSNYGARLSMIGHWLGGVLDAIERNRLAADTAVILCTDHGHYLGERDIFGKPGVPLYQPMVHIPLMIRWPGMAPGRRDMLTTSVGIHATIADIFGVSAAPRAHGRSLLPAIADPGQQVREYLLAGVWGREVHYIDRSHKYVRAPAQANAPLSMWSNRWSTMPQHHVPGRRLLPPDRRARIDFMPGSQVPVLRQPFVEGDLLPLWARNLRFSGNHLWTLGADPGEQTDLAGSALEAEYAHKLHAALLAIEAPDDQAIRLGLGL